MASRVMKRVGGLLLVLGLACSSDAEGGADDNTGPAGVSVGAPGADAEPAGADADADANADADADADAASAGSGPDVSPAVTDGGVASGDDAADAMVCEEGGDFSGPQLRDCDLPGFCGSCMWEKACASFLFRCAHNADCVCMAECVAQGGVAAREGCLGQCGLDDYPPGFAEWVKGASDMCWDEGCGTLDAPIPTAGAASGGAPTGGELDCAFDESLPYDPCGEVLQLQSEDGSVCARIERRDDGPGDDANTHWTLLDVRIGALGQVCHADSPEALCWFSSHHNYAEWLHVSCGGLHYDLNIGKGCGKLRSPDSTFRLHVYQQGPADDACAPTADGACAAVAPIDLHPVP